jgi:hypothetical protein
MEPMRFGPLSPVHLNKLKEKLDAHGANYEIYSEARPDHPDFLYIDIDTQYLLIVKEDLLNLGFEYFFKPATELPYQKEFICPKCRYQSLENGLCPKHKIPLLEWTEWLEFRRKKFLPFRRAVALVIVLVTIGLIIYDIFYANPFNVLGLP